MNEPQSGPDFSKYILDRMKQLEERNLALREQKDRAEGEKRLIETRSSSTSVRPGSSAASSSGCVWDP